MATSFNDGSNRCQLMKSHAPKPGICPACEGIGIVGEACLESFCQRRDYHHIPTDYFEAIATQPIQTRDQHLGLVIDGFLIVDTLGEGGFGKVYLSLQLPVMLKAALKLMTLSGTDPVMARQLTEKFEGEAVSLARLNHPNIVRLLRYGRFNEQPFMVMEFVEGGRTVKDEIRKRALHGISFEPAQIRHILEQLLNGLESAHREQIAHRDIKPENIMLQPIVGDENFVRILDFGLAKFLEQGDETSILIGTPSYMAPEQIARKNIGPWTDLYAVGVMFFEMVTGRRPFPGQSTQEIFAKKIDPDFDPVAAFEGDKLPKVVADFVHRAIARDVDKRFKTALEFREALAKVFESQQTDKTIHLAAGDLTQLLDSDSEMSRLRYERVLFEEEKRKLENEKANLDIEKREFDTLKRRISSLNITAVAAPNKLRRRDSYGDAPNNSGSRPAQNGAPDGVSRAQTRAAPGANVSSNQAPSGPFRDEGPGARPLGVPSHHTQQLGEGEQLGFGQAPAATSTSRQQKWLPIALVALFGIASYVVFLAFFAEPAGKTVQTNNMHKRQISGVLTQDGSSGSKDVVVMLTPDTRGRRDGGESQRIQTTADIAVVDVQALAVTKRLRIVPIYITTSGREDVDGVAVTVNGKSLGVASADRQIFYTFDSKTVSFRIKLTGRTIRTVIRTYKFDLLPDSRLEIGVKLQLR